MNPVSVSQHAGQSHAPAAPQHFSPHHNLQVLNLDDYEQLVSARASFVDFLLRGPEAAA